MTEAVTVTVSHHLGKAEAIRRLKEGFSHSHGHLGGMLTIEEHTWEGDTLRFGMRSLGQSATGSIHVLEDSLRIELFLPALLAKLAQRLLPALRKETARLLDKK